VAFPNNLPQQLTSFVGRRREIAEVKRSHAGLVGGGRIAHPDEITLAQRGVVFLDELPE
jgi:Magnesium chelatase, subunit ChlI